MIFLNRFQLGYFVGVSLVYLQLLSASLVSFCLKAIDEENSERKKRKKLERKGHSFKS